MHEYVSRAEAMSGSSRKMVKVKWVRANIGADDHPEVRCRPVAQEPGYGERLGEFFAGSRSLTIVRFLISVAAERDFGILLLDAKCAFLYSAMGRKV